MSLSNYPVNLRSSGFICGFIVLLCASAPAQQVGQNAAPEKSSMAAFTAGTQLVVETVAVTDNQGRPIEGLAATDFTVTEDGIPQQIRIFEYQTLPDAPPPAPRTATEQIRIYEKLGRMQISPERAGDNRYHDRRLLALYFDMTAMPPADQLRALDAAQTFIDTGMSAADLVAILRYAGGSVDVLQDFTDDRDRLLSVIGTMMVGEGQGYGESTDDASSSDTGAAFGQDDSEFNIFNTDRQLSALQTAAKMLGQLSEKKILIYFASGLRLNGLSNQAQLRATINTAVRAGVSFWPIDARGLTADAPLGDAAHGSPGNAGMYSGAAAMAAASDFRQSQDTLYALGADTGGKALFDNNDLAKAIVEAARSISSYYIIGYYTTNAAQDGKFRRIKITLNANVAAKLDYRPGYFAPKQFSKFTAAEKERQLEDALMLPDPITELTIAMEVDYFQLNRAEYFVPVVVKIPGRELALAKRGGAERTIIDFIGEIKDAYGTTITNVRDKVNVKLSDATAAELSKRPIIYDTGFTLLPGQYTIKFLARDAETGRIGTYQTTFVVPNLNREDKRLPISSVVLSGQRTELKDALFNAARAKDRADTENPLMKRGTKLVPSVTRVFRNDGALFVYLQAYRQGPAPPGPLISYVSFYRGREKVFQTQAVEVREALDNRLRTTPVELDIPLDQLAPGQYECQVVVLDPSGKKAAFWRAPVAIVP